MAMENGNREALQVLNTALSSNIMFNKENNFVAGKELLRSKQITTDPPPPVFGKGRPNEFNNIFRLKTETTSSSSSVFPGITIYQDDCPDSEQASNENVAPVEESSTLTQFKVDEKARNPLQEISVTNELKLASEPVPQDSSFEVTEYQHDILEYMREAERKCRPKYDYMRKQPDINSNMRTVLVDWIVEVCEEYRLNTETLYLSVNYVDRFLSYMSVVRSKLQLVGTSAMFIASKFEEIYPPDVSDFVYITDDTYTKRQVLRMEQLILKVLSFDMSSPTAYSFINLYVAIESLPDNVKFLAQFLAELSLLSASPFLQYLPSRIAAAAIAYARLLLNHDSMWTRSLELMTGYPLSHLQQVISELNQEHVNSQSMTQKAVTEKYKSTKYNEVSLIEPITLTDEMFEITNEKISKELEEAVKIMKM